MWRDSLRVCCSEVILVLGAMQRGKKNKHFKMFSGTDASFLCPLEQRSGSAMR